MYNPKLSASEYEVLRSIQETWEPCTSIDAMTRHLLDRGLLVASEYGATYTSPITIQAKNTRLTDIRIRRTRRGSHVLNCLIARR